MVNPRVDRTILLEDLARDRRFLRGLGYLELVQVVPQGSWRSRTEGLWDVSRGKWLAGPEMGQCHLFIVTVFRVHL